jgi:hypothetical protein
MKVIRAAAVDPILWEETVDAGSRKAADKHTVFQGNIVVNVLNAIKEISVTFLILRFKT